MLDHLILTVSFSAAKALNTLGIQAYSDRLMHGSLTFFISVIKLQLVSNLYVL